MQTKTNTVDMKKLTLPGSKSITNRNLVLASLSE
jgi:5-enolpyruvylshikimate-3-phosphate synthase